MTSALPSRADVIIVGAGHNSLTAGAYLSRAGLDVLVLEAHERIGGGSITEELTLPGIRHDTFSSGHVWLLTNPLLTRDELGLAAKGMRYVGHDPVVIMPFEDGTSLTVWRDPHRTAAEIEQFSTADARAWIAMFEEWSALAPIHLQRVTQPARVFPAATDPLEARYRELAAMSAQQVFEERFESPQLRSLLGWFSFGTAQPIDVPGTGLLAASVAVTWSAYGWINAVGGASALPDALAAAITEAGGGIVTDAEVVEILNRDGRATGVRTRDGRTFSATRAVISTANIARLPELMGDAALPPSFVDGARNWKPGLSLVAVHLVTAGQPAARAADASIPTVLLAPPASVERLQRQLDEALAGRASDDIAFLFAGCHTLIDPSRAPDGEGVVKLITFAPYAVDGDPANWEAQRAHYQRAMLARYAEWVDGYEPGDELAVTTLTPVDLEARNASYYRGAPQGGEMLPHQLGLNRPFAGYAHYRMPVAGLYQTGVTTHPGAPVSGWPGRHAAAAVLADLGVDVAAFFAEIAAAADPDGFECPVVETALLAMAGGHHIAAGAGRPAHISAGGPRAR